MFYLVVSQRLSLYLFLNTHQKFDSTISIVYNGAITALICLAVFIEELPG